MPKRGLVRAPQRPLLRPLLRSPFQRGSGSGSFTPAQINFTSGLWLDPSDISTGFQDSAGTTPQTASGQPTGKRLDKSGQANHVTQATGGARPEYDLISGISSDFFDGSDDGYSTASFTAGTLTNGMDCFIAIKRGSSVKSHPFYETPAGAKAFLSFDSAGAGSSATANAGSPTYAVNGVAVPGGTSTDRAQMDAAVTVGQWVVAEARGLDLSAWTQLGIGGYTLSSFLLNADVGGVILCPTQSTANRNSIRKWLGAKVGLSL